MIGIRIGIDYGSATKGLALMSIPQPVHQHLIELDVRDKNWSPALAAAQRRDREVDLGLEDFGTPILTLDLAAVGANIDAMQHWVAARGALLAPHGKTTMCPALWQWQLDRGAWAITVANEAQLRVARDAGVPRVIVANEFLSPPGLAWLAGQLNADPSFEVIVWVDSVAGVDQMTRHLTAAGLSRPLPVCVEVGAPGGRAGVRTRDQAIEVADVVAASTALNLRGVSAYEGAVPATGQEQLGAVDTFLSATADVARDLMPRCQTDAPIITAGGSAYFDRVAELLGPVADATGSRLVLRSGSYVVHDDGLYAGRTPAATRSGPRFVAAAHVWARVLSVPESDLALLDAGKRDVPYDAGLPTPRSVIRDRHPVPEPLRSATVVDINDQHMFWQLTQPASVAVGDLVQLGLSHPCTIFDKWRSALLVEGQLVDGQPRRVRGAVPTHF